VLDQTLESTASRFAAKSIKVESNLPDRPIFAQVDATRLVQLFTNVLETSLRYTNDGGVCRVSCFSQDGELCIEFEDSETGGDVVDWIREHKPDLMLLDLMLPERDGMSICKEIRTFSDVPIMMVTARVDEIDRLLGLELGADDYICIPFSPREVVARVKTILRRIKVRATSDSAYLGIELDEGLYRASINGNPLNLTPVEFRLLSVLFRHPGRVFSRDQLMDRVYTDNRA
jgi:DNA-binding response OmpR family regulator